MHITHAPARPVVAADADRPLSSDNKIDHLDAALLFRPDGTQRSFLYLDDNPLQGVLSAFRDDPKKYLSYMRYGSDAIAQVPTLMLGAAGAGKTSSLRSVAGTRHARAPMSTVAVDVNVIVEWIVEEGPNGLRWRWLFGEYIACPILVCAGGA